MTVSLILCENCIEPSTRAQFNTETGRKKGLDWNSMEAREKEGRKIPLSKTLFIFKQQMNIIKDIKKMRDLP